MSKGRDSQTSARHGNVLIVEDEEAVCWSLRRILTDEGYGVQAVASAEAGFDYLSANRVDVVILDVRLPGMDGLAALARLRRDQPELAVVVITAYSDMETTVRAVHGGAFEFLPKPFDLDTVVAVTARAVAHTPAAPAAPAEPGEEPTALVGRSPAMREVFKQIAYATLADCCVLITGESGTGKELVARAIYANSARSGQAFIPLNVASLNPNLVESELFGHARGSFTGAVGETSGLLALAQGGTLFLDEVAEIPLEVQVKLLRVLEAGEYLPVGSAQPQRLNVRILAATHAALAELVRAGRFRQDLWYRLNVYSIHLPPLRERAEDILPLFQALLARLNYPHRTVDPHTLRLLQGQRWEGNVRELRNAVEYACVMARGAALRPEHFPPTRVSTPAVSSTAVREAVLRWTRDQIDTNTSPGTLHRDLSELTERAAFEEVLRRAGGNRQEAARLLGLDRATVRRKIAYYGLDPSIPG